MATLGLEEGLSDALGQTRARFAVEAARGVPAGQRVARGASAAGDHRPVDDPDDATRRRVTSEKPAGVTAGYTVTDVGNVTGSGYDSFVISAPGLAPNGVGGLASFVGAGESAAYLVFGSKQVNISNAVDYLNLASGTPPGPRTGAIEGRRPRRTWHDWASRRPRSLPQRPRPTRRSPRHPAGRTGDPSTASTSTA